MRHGIHSKIHGIFPWLVFALFIFFLSPLVSLFPVCHYEAHKWIRAIKWMDEWSASAFFLARQFFLSFSLYFVFSFHSYATLWSCEFVCAISSFFPQLHGVYSPCLKSHNLSKLLCMHDPRVLVFCTSECTTHTGNLYRLGLMLPLMLSLNMNAAVFGPFFLYYYFGF